jgi:hypothetical protein
MFRRGRTLEAIKRILLRESQNPFGLVFARFVESWVYRLMREPQRTEAAATLALAICEEHGFPFLRAQVGTLMGWARAQLGSPGEGISLIRQGLAELAGSGARLGITDQLTGLAEAQALDGMLEEALGTIEDPEEIRAVGAVKSAEAISMWAYIQFES